MQIHPPPPEISGLRSATTFATREICDASHLFLEFLGLDFPSKASSQCVSSFHSTFHVAASGKHFPGNLVGFAFSFWTVAIQRAGNGITLAKAMKFVGNAVAVSSSDLRWALAIVIVFSIVVVSMSIADFNTGKRATRKDEEKNPLGGNAKVNKPKKVSP